MGGGEGAIFRDRFEIVLRNADSAVQPLCRVSAPPVSCGAVLRKFRMAVRLVIGRARSGKTRRCFDGVVEALRAEPLGPPVYWIVPKQATFMTERHLTCASGLGGFCRARVLSFEALGEEILEECGGAAVPEVTALGRQMILGHLLRKHQPRLRFFAQAARQAGLAAKL